MIDIDYQGVFDAIIGTLPNGWDKVVIHFIHWADSYEVTYYVHKPNHEYIDCFALGIPDEALINITMELNKIISDSESDWKALTLTIDSDGNFNAQADYDSDIDDTANYIESWKKTNLN